MLNLMKKKKRRGSIVSSWKNKDFKKLNLKKRKNANLRNKRDWTKKGKDCKKRDLRSCAERKKNKRIL